MQILYVVIWKPLIEDVFNFVKIEKPLKDRIETCQRVSDGN